ncbi:hypothetical protein CJF30_00011206 [Rutstroemia sp. NJR-2017a BBW]|nr:hypothetical protein CJF30_00011206 [Rutstroemia sp. NJR-2017a BBW]
MDPFTHLSVFKVVVCTVCQHAVLPSQISPHLSSSNSHNMTKEARERIADKVNQIEGLILGRAELDKLPIPITPTPPPIPELGQPRRDGKKCPFACPIIPRRMAAIRSRSGARIGRRPQVGRKLAPIRSSLCGGPVPHCGGGRRCAVHVLMPPRLRFPAIYL